MDSAGSRSFEAVSASNLPLGIDTAPEDAQPETDPLAAPPSPPALPPSPPARAQVIDLTSDPDPLPSTSRRPLLSPSRSIPNSDNDIIFAGQNAPPVPARRPPRRIARRDSPMVAPAEPARRPQTAFMESVASLTAGIHAGLFSFHPEPPTPPAPGPSRILVRDSPPPQVRRTPNPTATFGGGGRVSGGFFSGLVASGLHSIRDFTRLGNRERPEPDNRFLERIFVDWTASRNGPNQNGGHLSRELFAAMFDFGAHEYHHAPIESSYIEAHSHPHRIKSGFTKEIIPLDREFVTIDSDSEEAVLVKQQAKPVCASCDDLLLMGQTSNFGTIEGRRPWILACGHVVDSKCLENARERARAARRAKTAKSKAKSGGGRGRTKRPASTLLALSGDLDAAHTSLEALTSALHTTSSKRIRLNSSASISNPPDSFKPSLKSSSASSRENRARARDARRSTETIGISPPSLVALPLESSLPDAVPAESAKTDKGKGKQLEDLSDVGLQIDLAPKGLVTNPILDLPLTLTWIQCPVKDCKGPIGDVLAKKGSKTAPWEMFV